VEPDRVTKSISHEETYATDLRDLARLRRQVVRMADAVGGRIRAQGLQGRTVTLKVRFADFSTITRSRTLAEPTGNASLVATVAHGLLDGVDISSGVRLLGVGLSSLVARQTPPRQLSLEDLAEGESVRDQVETAVDAVRARFGTGAMGPAVLLEAGGSAGSEGGNRPSLDVKRPGDTQWGPTSG
jgi:DNA polymerase-4